MTKWIGRRLKIGIGLESTRGTLVTPSYYVTATAFSFLDKVTKAISTAGYGGIWGGSQALVAQRWAEGDIEIEMGDKSFGEILHAAFGIVSSISFDGAYKHIYTLQNDNRHNSLSIQTEDPIGDLSFAMAMINSLAIEITPEDLVKYTVSFISKPSEAGSITPSYSAENKFLGRYLNFKIAADTSSFGTTTICLKRLALTINKNLKPNYCLGNIAPTDINNKMIEITGELELVYEDRAYRDYMLDGDYKAIRIDLVNTDVTIGTTNPSFRIDLSKVEFDEWDSDHSLDDIVNQTITFKALYDLDGNDNLFNDCYLINEDPSYPTSTSTSSTSSSSSSSTSSSSSSSTSA